MVGGHERDHGVLEQRRPREIALAAADDRQVERAAFDAAHEWRAVAGGEVDLDAGVGGRELRQQLRDGIVEGAIGGTHAHAADLDAADERRLLLAALAQCGELREGRQHGPAVGRGLDAGLGAHEEGEADLGLQRAHHAADARGRVPELLGRVGQVALFEDGQECLAFARVHGCPIIA